MRGSITGANGQVLAMTVAKYQVTADPPLIPAAKLQHVADALAGPLGMTSAAVLAKLQHPTSPDYVLLANNVPAQASGQITALDLPGIYQTASYARSYPDGSVAANLVGFTGTKQRHHHRRGRAGARSTTRCCRARRAASRCRSADGQQIPLPAARHPGRERQQPAPHHRPGPAVRGRAGLRRPGQEDQGGQLHGGDHQPAHRGRAGHGAVPDLRPGRRPTVSQTTNLAVQAQFQPGSTAKVITAAAALEHGGQTPMSAYNIPYQIRRGGQFIHDAEWAPGERYTIAGIIAHSSNIGMSQVAAHISEQTQYDYLRAFGLGQPTGIGLPGESDGDLPPVSQWYGDTRYTLSFGQGVAATALQMAEVYATIANGGVRVQPTLVQGTTNSAGKYTAAAPQPSHRVIQPKTAQRAAARSCSRCRASTRRAASRGASSPATRSRPRPGPPRSPTGNARCASTARAGSASRPGDKPQLVVAVNVQNPRKGGHFGAVVAGPVFYQVMKDALATLQIPPDGATPANVRLNAP